MSDAPLMMLKISLVLTLPRDANALDMVYWLKAVRKLARTCWPGARLLCRPVIIPGPVELPKKPA